MKIIQEGKYGTSKWKQQLKCTGAGNNQESTACGALLEVEYDDLRYFAEQEYPWRTQPEAVSFKCPICNAMTDISRGIWPITYSQLEKFTTAWRDAPAHAKYIHEKEST